MIYRIFQPTPALAAIVEHYWYAKIELSEAASQHYATPLLQGMTFNFSKQKEHHAYHDQVVTLDKQVYIFGQSTTPRIVTTSDKGVDILGVKFKPLGISRVTGINMEHLADQIISAEDIWGGELDLLCDEMQSAGTLEGGITVLERFLINRYLHTVLHYRVDNVGNALSIIEQAKGSCSIKELQNQTSTSRKTLERAFLSYLGLTPKLYSRIVRFNAIKDWMDKPNLDQNITGLAYDFGFYDNSHFTAEFKYFSGFTPKDYLSSLK